jgi:ATP-dependent Clp protease adapter protein ClpS
VEAVLLALAAAASAGALWWHQARPVRRRALASAFEPDADVALHVAAHEARGRDQAIGSLHLLYGLLQDETITQTLRDAGHDPDALEDRALAALDAVGGVVADVRGDDDDDDEVERVYGRALHNAYSAGRKVTCRDLWAYLAGSPADAVLVAAGIRHVDVLFRMCHGAEPAVDAAAGDVHVVLRNDDYTTCEFVAEALARCFALAPDAAHGRMMQTHTDGRAVIGRYAAADARAKIRELRALARARGFPLWIGIEPI